jgi:histidinol-phosphate aminotransferase
VTTPPDSATASGAAAVIRGLLREDLRHLDPYGAPQLDVPVQLNTNENPYGPSERLVAAITGSVAAVAATLNRYPDRDAVALRTDLAAYLGHGVTVEQVWAANGSNEIIQQLLQAFGGPGRTALGFEPSYAMHPLLAGVTCTQWLEGSRDDGYGLSTAPEQVKQHQPDVVFIASPNNPTGTSAPVSLISDIYDAAPGLVVVDEAYAEFAREGTPSALTLLPGRPRLVVHRTMSKAFAAAGTRLGYLAADPAVVDALLRVRLPYHLSTVTMAVARAAIAHKDEPLATVETLRRDRDDLVRWLRERGLTVADSDANFVLFGVFNDRAAVWRGLLNRGVLIRNIGPAGWLRVTVGTPAENDAFKQAMTEELNL